MKKARLMLSALGICAVLATAFAFTAQKFSNKVVYTGTSSTDCIHPKVNRILTDAGTPVFATLISGAICTETFTAIPDNDN